MIFFVVKIITVGSKGGAVRKPKVFEQKKNKKETRLPALVKEMMESDVLLMKKNIDLLKAGHKILKQSE